MSKFKFTVVNYFITTVNYGDCVIHALRMLLEFRGKA